MGKNHNTTAYRERLKKKILDTAIPLFKSNGVKGVKMDNIATELQISKRTLYEVYGNKEDLLFECVKHNVEDFRKMMNDYAQTAENEMDIVAYFIKEKLKELDQQNQACFTEIHKYPSIVEYLQKDREEQRARFALFMRKGIEHGFFRYDLNYDIANTMLDAAMSHVMNSMLYKKYSLKEILKTFITIYIRVCCTDKGIKYLDKFLNDNGTVPN